MAVGKFTQSHAEPNSYQLVRGANCKSSAFSQAEDMHTITTNFPQPKQAQRLVRRLR